MMQINMVEPKGVWYRAEKWRGIYTFLFRQPGQCFRTQIVIHIWGVPSSSKSFFTAKKVQTVIYYQEN